MDERKELLRLLGDLKIRKAEKIKKEEAYESGRLRGDVIALNEDTPAPDYYKVTQTLDEKEENKLIALKTLSFLRTAKRCLVYFVTLSAISLFILFFVFISNLSIIF